MHSRDEALMLTRWSEMDVVKYLTIAKRAIAVKYFNRFPQMSPKSMLAEITFICANNADFYSCFALTHVNVNSDIFNLPPKNVFRALPTAISHISSEKQPGTGTRSTQ